MKADLTAAYDQLMGNCREAGFAGYDPFDGLESRIFQATPLRRFRAGRFAWQQAVKRAPVNLRSLLMVPMGVNPKGLALFALSAIARMQAGDGRSKEEADQLIKMLLERSIRSGQWLAFGYNFDWQSRAFFAPKGTPTIVPTAFAARALYAHSGSESQQLLTRLARFVTNELNRPVETADEVCFSYTPIDQTTIYNASLLAGEVLAYSGEDEHLQLARKAVRFVLNGQRADGSWLYGPGEIHGWVDNFHTAFILDSLRRISQSGVDEPEISNGIHRGFEYWIANFFLGDGTPKYFDRQTFPIDIHSAAAAIVTLSGFAKTDDRALPLARKIAEWTISDLIGPDGNTYYQKRRLYTVKTSFIRWGQAWMAYAFASLIEAETIT
jgi:hypothetical protein